MRIESTFNEGEVDEIAGEIELREDIFHQRLIVTQPSEPLFEPVADGDVEESYMALFTLSSRTMARLRIEVTSSLGRGTPQSPFNSWS